MVDDHEPWRQQIASLLQNTGEWPVIGEAVDGPDAIGMAESLRPDLILLDVQLPTLSGIQTAARILEANPSARILFLSGHKSWDVVAAALDTGARGYVLKLHAVQELLLAMRAVTSGRRFVCAALGGRPHLRGMPAPRTHEAGFYLDEATLLDSYERFAAAALMAGKAVMCVSSADRRAALHQRLRGRGLDLEGAITQQQYIECDVHDLLAPMMANGMPDETLFWKAAAPLVLRAARGCRVSRPVVACFGDAAPSLWNAGRIDAAIRLEQLCDDLVGTFNIDVLCGYTAGSGSEASAGAHERLCAAHSATHTR